MTVPGKEVGEVQSTRLSSKSTRPRSMMKDVIWILSRSFGSDVDPSVPMLTCIKSAQMRAAAHDSPKPG